MENLISLGLRPDLVIMWWVFGILAIIAIIAFAIEAKFGPDSETPIMTTIFAGIFAVLLGIALIIGYVPFQGKYHYLYETQGNVVSVSNVFTESGGDLTRVPVIVLDSVTRPITVKDPRIVEMVGQNITLSCTIDWVWAGADKLDCWIAD